MIEITVILAVSTVGDVCGEWMCTHTWVIGVQVAIFTFPFHRDVFLVVA